MRTTECRLQSRSFEDCKNQWKPANGTRDEWLRCHGDSCATYNRVVNKLRMLRSLMSDDETVAAQSTTESSEQDEGTFDEDMWLSEEQVDEILKQQKGQNSKAKRSDSFYWRDKFRKMPIMYMFDGRQNGRMKSQMRKAVKHIMDNTCVTYKEIQTNVDVKESHLVIFVRKGRCTSHVGRTTDNGRILAITINKYCSDQVGELVHVLCHALGIEHESSRYDRDDVMEMFHHNIIDKDPAVKYSKDTHLPYDIGSIMHPVATRGAKPNTISMLPWDRQFVFTMGQRNGLSFLDAQKINSRLCYDTCSSKLARPCSHHGYQDPKNCTQCRCPDGFAGQYCDELEPPKNADCGGEIRLSDNAQMISSPGHPGAYQSGQSCNWLIKAPANQHVLLEFQGTVWMSMERVALFNHEWIVSCTHWVEIHYKKDLAIAGPRVCSNTASNPYPVFTSESNEMLVTFRTEGTYQWYNNAGFRARVSIVGTAPRTTTTTTATTTTTTTTTMPITTAPYQPQNQPQASSDALPWRCFFEDDSGKKTKCGMKELTTDEFDWTVHTGPTKSEHTGPKEAHSLPYYIYIETSNPRREGDKAILMLPDFQYSGLCCVYFRYHMFGYHINELRLVQYRGSNPETLWSRKRKQEPFIWHKGTQEVNLGYSDKLAFVGIRGEEYAGDIALDDLEVETGHCRDALTSSGVDNWMCSFEDEREDETLCGMKQSKDDDFDWTMKWGKTPSDDTGPKNAYSVPYYIYIETSNPRRLGDRAVIFLPKAAHAGTYCIRFQYHMHGYHINELRLVKVIVGGSETTLWSKKGKQEPIEWHKATHEVNIGENEQLAFVGIRGEEYAGDIALDDVAMNQGGCGTKTITTTTTTTTTRPTTIARRPIGRIRYKCRFEDDKGEKSTCAMKNGEGSDIDWIWMTGATPSAESGPDMAHSPPYYVYVDTSKRGYDGERAILMLPNFDYTGPACVSFHYFMRGKNIVELQLGQSTTPGAQTILWSRNIEHRPFIWYKVQKSTTIGGPDRLYFIAIRGNEPGGDIALDDVAVDTGHCRQDSGTTTTNSPTPSWRFFYKGWNCSFDDKNDAKTLCGMQQSRANNYDWKITSEGTPSQWNSPRKAFSNPFYIKATVDTDNPIRPNDKAMLLLPKFDYHGTSCLSFAYHMHGTKNNELRLVKYSGKAPADIQWSNTEKIGQDRTVWQKELALPSINNSMQLAFIAIGGEVALDNILLMPYIDHSCPNKQEKWAYDR